MFIPLNILNLWNARYQCQLLSLFLSLDLALSANLSDLLNLSSFRYYFIIQQFQLYPGLFLSGVCLFVFQLCLSTAFQLRWFSQCSDQAWLSSHFCKEGLIEGTLTFSVASQADIPVTKYAVINLVGSINASSVLRLPRYNWDHWVPNLIRWNWYLTIRILFSKFL